jgi:hypothetical protein
LNELSNLRELVEREIARRHEAGAHPWAPTRAVIYGAPDDDAKVAEVQTRFPGQIIVVRKIVGSARRHEPVRDTPDTAGTRDSGGLLGARERVALLRENA